jgi:hypothetical protein
MFRKSLTLLALALAAAAVAAPIAQSSSTPKVDPLAVSYLMGQGLSPAEVNSWTAGACSHRAKDAACYAMLGQPSDSSQVDPLAVSYLMGQGLSPSQVKSWTVGACSHQVKDASCYAMFPSQAAPTQVTSPRGFQWGDAGIGAGFALGIVLLAGAAGAIVLTSRRNGRHQTARAA